LDRLGAVRVRVRAGAEQQQDVGHDLAADPAGHDRAVPDIRAPLQYALFRHRRVAPVAPAEVDRVDSAIDVVVITVVVAIHQIAGEVVAAESVPIGRYGVIPVTG